MGFSQVKSSVPYWFSNQEHRGKFVSKLSCSKEISASHLVYLIARKAKQCKNVSEGTSEMPLGNHGTTALQNIVVIFTGGHSHSRWRAQMTGAALLRQASD